MCAGIRYHDCVSVLLMTHAMTHTLRNFSGAGISRWRERFRSQLLSSYTIQGQGDSLTHNIAVLSRRGVSAVPLLMCGVFVSSVNLDVFLGSNRYL